MLRFQVGEPVTSASLTSTHILLATMTGMVLIRSIPVTNEHPLGESGGVTVTNAHPLGESGGVTAATGGVTAATAQKRRPMINPMESFVPADSLHDSVDVMATLQQTHSTESIVE